MRLRRQGVRDYSPDFKPEEVISVRLRVQFLRDNSLVSQPGEASNLRRKLGGDSRLKIKFPLRLTGGDRLGFLPEGILRLQVELPEPIFKDPLDFRLEREVRLPVRWLTRWFEAAVTGCVESWWSEKAVGVWVAVFKGLGVLHCVWLNLHLH